MSLSFLTKPIGGSKKDPADQTGRAEPKGSKPARSAKAEPIRGGTASVNVGGAPRVDLMPPEIRLKRSQLRMRRSLRFVLFGVFVVVVAGCIGTWALGTVAQASLSAAQAQQQQLVAEQAKYSDVTSAQKSIALIKAGQKVGDSTEIKWADYLKKMQAILPGGATFSSITITSTTPMTDLGQSTTPLEGSRVATILFAVKSPTLPSVPSLLDSLKTLPGFVDATPGDVTSDGVSGAYTANVTLHINSQAFANRFDKAAAESAAAAAKSSAGQAASGGN